MLLNWRQWLRALSVLIDDLSSVHTTYTGHLTTSCSSSSRVSHVSDLCGHLYSPHTIKILKRKKKRCCWPLQTSQKMHSSSSLLLLVSLRSFLPPEPKLSLPLHQTSSPHYWTHTHKKTKLLSHWSYSKASTT